MPDAPAGRRGLIAGGISILALVAFGVFVLPFAFVTPPPIITRFTATHVFSPGSTTGRDVARVSIRLSEPSSVGITIKDGAGVIVHTIANGTVVRTTTLSVPWAGQTDAGTPLPDGTYTIDLDAHAGAKKFSKSRTIVVDTTPPAAPRLMVQPRTASCVARVTGPGEATRLLVAAVGTGARTDSRDLPAGGTFTWIWNRHRANGNAVTGTVQIKATVSDPVGNEASTRRRCAAVAVATPKAATT